MSRGEGQSDPVLGGATAGVPGRVADGDTISSILGQGPAVAFIWTLTEVWQVDFVSDNIGQFGYAIEEFYDGSVRIADIIHPEDSLRVIEEMAQFVNSEASDFHQRYRILTSSGNVRWVDGWISMIEPLPGEPARVQGLLVDISTRINYFDQAQKYLALSDELFLSLNQGGRVVAVNEQTCLITGVAESEIIGRDWFAEFVPEESRAEARRLFGEAKEEARELQSEILVGDARYTINWRFMRQTARDDLNEGVIAFGTNITEAVLARQRIEDLARFPSEHPDPILRIDRNGDVLDANPAAQRLVRELSFEDDADLERRHENWSDLIAASLASLASRSTTTHVLEVGSRSYLFDIIPVQDRDYVNLYGRDISLELEQETRLTDMALTIPGALFQYTLRLDGSYSINYMSPGCFDIWELTPDEIRADPSRLWAMVHPADVDALKESVRASAENMSLWTHEHRVVIKSKELKWFRATGMPHRMANGDVRWNTFVFDISAEKRAADAASAALLETVSVLSAALEIRDPYTVGHEKRVKDVAGRIARKMNLDPNRITGLELAATIHDVGKMQVPAEILSKPTALSDVEYELIKVHATVGADLVGDLKFEWPVADMIRQHHERIDGSGYPLGLTGEEILLEARILGVADTVEAMASHRPYRPALGLDKAAEEIRRGSGTIYDPSVATACLWLIEHGQMNDLLVD